MALTRTSVAALIAVAGPRGLRDEALRLGVTQVDVDTATEMAKLRALIGAAGLWGYHVPGYPELLANPTPDEIPRGIRTPTGYEDGYLGSLAVVTADDAAWDGKSSDDDDPTQINSTREFLSTMQGVGVERRGGRRWGTGLYVEWQRFPVTCPPAQSSGVAFRVTFHRVQLALLRRIQSGGPYPANLVRVAQGILGDPLFGQPEAVLPACAKRGGRVPGRMGPGPRPAMADDLYEDDELGPV